MIETDFWTTGAQTMPVLALAIVVEARSISSKWVPGKNRLAKSIQGIVWAAPLLLYAVSIPACFQALAGDKVSTAWTDVISFAVTLGVCSLLLNPAIELIVRSNAYIAAHALRLIQAHRIMRKALRLRLVVRRLQRTQRRSLQRLEWNEILLRAARWRLDHSATPHTTEESALYPRIAKNVDAILRDKARILQEQTQAAAEMAGIRKEYSDIRAEHLYRLEAIVTGAEASTENSAEITSAVAERTNVTPKTTA